MSLAATLLRRSFATTRRTLAEGAPLPGPAKRPIGGFRGGIIGFLAGFSLASGVAAYQLLEEYKVASAALQASIEQLQANTEKVSSHIRRIEAVETELKALAASSVSKDEHARARAELKKATDGLRLEHLDLKAHVWGIQQDLHSLSKAAGATSAKP